VFIHLNYNASIFKHSGCASLSSLGGFAAILAH
jgi:hypothetical protein